MKRCFILLTGFCWSLFASAQQTAPSAYDDTIKVNYVRTWDALAPLDKEDTLLARPSKDVRVSTQYFDGLGLSLQTVAKKGSLITGDTARDLIVPVVYDAFGREQYKYLPFAANTTGSNTSISDGYLKLNPFQQDSAFCKSKYSDELYFYNKNVFEQSPLGRVLEAYAPGDNWVGTAGQSSESNRRGIKSKNWFNTITDSVRIWTVTNVSNSFGTYDTSGSYAVGALIKTVVQNEHNNQVITFTDKTGKVILKKVQLTALPDSTGNGAGYSGWLCTYYIYDDMRRLRAVIQPEGVKALATGNWSLTTTLLSEQCFRYEYDNRGRMVMKKVPGAGVVWMVYDARDRNVMTQDSLMRSNHQWLYTQYDNLNRAVATGLMSDGSHYNDLAYHTVRADTSTGYPALGSYTIDTLTKTFYDDYSWRSGQSNPLSDTRNTTYDTYFQSASNSVWPYPQDVTVQSNRLYGMVTGIKVKVIETGAYLYTANFYDDKGRVSQVQSTNISTGTDISTTQYTWAGQPLMTIVKNEKAGTNSQTNVVLTQNTYDDLFRITKVEKKISNSKVNGGSMPCSWTIINSNEYDALGQLSKKKLGDDPLDSLQYDYNIRGWVLGMNRSYVKDTTAGSHWFGFDLGYDKTSFTVNGNSKSYAAAQYNGNIGGMLWKSKGDGALRKYDFTYDATNRLTGADFNQLTNNSFSKAALIDFSVSGLTYDQNGNILTMNQKGLKLNQSYTIDSLVYSYNSNSNKLNYVHDLANDTTAKLGDFTEINNNTSQDYTYDGNGSLLTDNNKGISDIHYNHLNMPDSIHINGKGFIKYIYDAAGTKLEKITSDSTVSPAKTNTTLYLFANYLNDTLQYLPTEEGIARAKDSSLIVYDYFEKDHLGNVRLILTNEEQTDAYPVASLETDSLTNEKRFYSGLDSGRVAISTISGYPTDTYTSPNDYTQQLNGNGPKIGAGIILRVMAGDKFNVRVSSYYPRMVHFAWPYPNSALTSVVNALNTGVGAITGTHGGPTTSQLQSADVFTSGVTDFLTEETNDYGNAYGSPKTYLSWILFDEQFKFVASSSGFAKIGDNRGNLLVTTESDLPVDKSGFLYVYVSNETPDFNVYFDNLQVTHIRGPLTEETHYYPFGLTMKGISSNAFAFGDPSNKYKYNGKEEQSQEFSDESGLEIYDFGKRMQDIQIGRWWKLDPKADLLEMSSPYSVCYNNPISFVDPDGDLSILINGLTRDDNERASSKYWGNAIIDAIKDSGIPYSGRIKYVDGNQYLSGAPLSTKDYPRDEHYNITTYGVKKGDILNGNSAQQRNDAGYLQGRVDFMDIVDKLARDPKTGKIIEKIEIYTHSRGAAFGAGYTQALLDEIAAHADQFADPNNEIDLIFNMAPNEANRDGTTEPKGVNAYSMSHGDDLLSSMWQRGTKANFHSYERNSGWIGSHEISSFEKDIKEFTKAFVNSKGDSSKLIDNFIGSMKKLGIDVTVMQ